MRRQDIERLLPSMYQRAAGDGGVLAALLGTMEAMHAPTEQLLSTVDDMFTPYRSPDVMVAFLAGWLGYDHVLGDRSGPGGVPVGRLRDLVAAGASLARQRGTATGLRRLVETVTGVAVRVVEPVGRPFHVVVGVPAEAADRLALIRRLVEAEKPAATTFELVLDSPDPEPHRDQETTRSTS
jgi:phage tail-like protein